MNAVKKAEQKVAEKVGKLKGWRTYLIILGNLGVIVLMIVRIFYEGSIQWLTDFFKETQALVMSGVAFYTMILATWKVHSPHPMKHENNDARKD